MREILHIFYDSPCRCTTAEIESPTNFQYDLMMLLIEMARDPDAVMPTTHMLLDQINRKIKEKDFT